MNTLVSVPEHLFAAEPPERRGIARDRVRLLVINRETGTRDHVQFRDITRFLRRGDLLVLNTSRTLPAVLQGSFSAAQQGSPSIAQPGSAGILPASIELRLAEHLPDDTWQSLVLSDLPIQIGLVIDIGEHLMATVIAPDAQIPNMWRIAFNKSGWQLTDLLYRLGQPVRYEYVSQPWGLTDYQTVYANVPGSAEMPSAGRALTWELLVKLQKAGVNVANLVLHTGLSSYMDDDVDAQHIASEEEFEIPQSTADAIKKCRMAGGRVIAVGTTVVRALETVGKQKAGRMPALPGCAHQVGRSYTRLRIDRAHKLQVVDGLITGLHEPEASHLDLLNAFLERELLAQAYREAVDLGYLWHEFGDLNLIV